MEKRKISLDRKTAGRLIVGYLLVCAAQTALSLIAALREKGRSEALPPKE